MVVEHSIAQQSGPPRRQFSVYAHLEAGSVPSEVKPPSKNGAYTTVACGQIIGKVGNTGFSTAAHLHFQIDREVPDRNHPVCGGNTEKYPTIDDFCRVSTRDPIRALLDFDEDGFKLADGDCDDTNAAVYPGATANCSNAIETCSNGIDDNCNLLIDSADPQCAGVLPEVIAGPLTNPGNGHTYYVLAAATWHAAEAKAVALGGHLATINDSPENDWVASNVASLAPNPGHLWIGLEDFDAPDPRTACSFHWISGDPSTYRNWRSDNPEFLDTEFCTLVLGPGTNPSEEPKKWVNLICGNVYTSVVEVSAPVCGNGFQEGSEECDGLEGAACHSGWGRCLGRF